MLIICLNIWLVIVFFFYILCWIYGLEYVLICIDGLEFNFVKFKYLLFKLDVDIGCNEVGLECSISCGL